MKQFAKEWGQFTSVILLLVFSIFSQTKNYIILGEDVKHQKARICKLEDTDEKHDGKFEVWIQAVQKLTYQVERVGDHLEDLKNND